jgi:hypothetical protein
MNGDAARRMGSSHARKRGAMLGAALGLAATLGACSHHQPDADEAGANDYPTNYKADVVSAMHAYLNFPTGVRDAAIAPPALKPSGPNGPDRYLVCLKFNAKKNATDYAGMRQIAAVFVGGRLDRFLETPKDQCAGAAFTPFPELQNLPP